LIYEERRTELKAAAPKLIYCRNNYSGKPARATEQGRNKTEEADMTKIIKKRNNPLNEYVNVCLPEPFETNYHVQLSFAVLQASIYFTR
jgi:hypothetical protein